MPNEVVWVDKIINPLSVVLTHNEAMNVLKKAKSVSGRSHFTQKECKPSTSTSPVKVEEQKDECLKFLAMHAYEMESKPIIEMQQELQSISASKTAYEKALAKRVLFADGLPRIQPSLLLKKDMHKKQKDKKSQSSLDSRLSNLTGSAINKESLNNLYVESDDEVAVLSSSPEQSDAKESEEPVTKRKRIIISDDEDNDDIADNVCEKEDISTEAPKHEKVQMTNNADTFGEAFTACIEATSNNPITITFEANANNIVQVIASTSVVHDIINDSEIPPNSMFTDEAVSSVFNSPVSPAKNTVGYEWFPASRVIPGKMALTPVINPKSVNLKKLDKPLYAEMLKDEKFCTKLLDAFESDVDATPFMNIEIDNNDKEFGYLPRQSIMNSLFSKDDFDFMCYEADRKKFNSNRIREKQRIQHPYVKLPHQSMPKETSSTAKTSKVKSKKIEYGIKGILKRFNADDSISSQISMKKELIGHNTVIHETLNYLMKNKMTEKSSDEIKMAYFKLKKYSLTFLEKFNILTTMPKELSAILCLLDDLGLRFNKETLENLEKDCITLFKVSDLAEKVVEKEGASKAVVENSEMEKKVRFSKNVEHQFI